MSAVLNPYVSATRPWRHAAPVGNVIDGPWWQSESRFARRRDRTCFIPTSERVIAGSLEDRSLIPLRPRRALISVEYVRGDWSVYIIARDGSRARLCRGLPYLDQVHEWADILRRFYLADLGIAVGIVG
jgi:hypothetical protein